MCKKVSHWVVFGIIVLLLTGCATTPNPYEIIERQKQEIAQLNERLAEREQEFEATKNKLMHEFKKQIEEGRIKIETLERGLVLTMLEDILFDSGKDII